MGEQIGLQSSIRQSGAPGSSPLSLSTVILPAILLLAYLAQCAWFIQSQSFTFDEPIDILSGLEQWRTGQFSGGAGMNDHPPLARMLCTLPAINSRFQIGDQVVPNPEAVAWHNSDFDSFGHVLPNPEAMAWHTRPVNAMLGAVLGLLLWLAARSLYSTNAANFVLALFAFSPSLIAHFSLAATNDGVMTLMLFATVFQLFRWHHDRSWPQTVLLGLVLGGLLLAKASRYPLFVVAIALMLVLKPGSIAIRPAEWNWRQAVTAFLICFLIVWGAYRFHVSKVTLAASDIQIRIAIPKRADPIMRHSSRTFQISVPVPAFEFVQGLGYQLRHNKGGHFAFLLGRSYVGGSTIVFPDRDCAQMAHNRASALPGNHGTHLLSSHSASAGLRLVGRFPRSVFCVCGILESQHSVNAIFCPFTRLLCYFAAAFGNSQEVAVQCWCSSSLLWPSTSET